LNTFDRVFIHASQLFGVVGNNKTHKRR
jgi:hypothetical protein